MKCDICREKIAETFLKKVVGTVIKDHQYKKRYVCSSCQKKFPSKAAVLEQLK